jgi:predicted nicotinamide N-methyase
MEQSTTCSEAVDFGPSFGETEIVQFSGSAFHNACLQSNCQDDDGTGLRIHAGAHVAVRFLLRHPGLVQDRKVVELGCGTGIFSLVGTRGGTLPSKLVITDGNDEAVHLARSNSNKLSAADAQPKISCDKLLWGSEDIVRRFLHRHLQGVTEAGASNDASTLTGHLEQGNEQGTIEFPVRVTNDAANGSAEGIKDDVSAAFDVVLGCELTYYRTDIAELCNTVVWLTGNNGLFVHAHIFRRPGQDIEMVDFFHSKGWETLRIPIADFIDREELKCHGEWYKVHCLVSGPTHKLTEILKTAIHDRCKPFQGVKDAENDDDEEEEQHEDDQHENFGRLFS